MVPPEISSPDALSLQPYSTSTGFALTVNLIIGTGAFALPYSTIQAGSVLSLGCLLLFTAMSCVCLCYVLETMARTGGVLAAVGGIPGASSLTSSPKSIPTEEDPLLSVPTPIGHYVPQIGYSKIDYALMCSFFGGHSAHVLVHICMALYSLNVLWMYAAVFASSVDTLFFKYALNEDCNIYLNPSFSCSVGYTIAVCTFGIIVVLLALTNIEDQASIQRYLTMYRFIAFFLMIVTCMYAWTRPNVFDESAQQHAPYLVTLPKVQWSGFGLAFCTTAVALDVHWNCPDVVQPLKNKADALRMTLLAMILSATIYGFIGWVCAEEFGKKTLPLVTLNWASYTGIGGGFDPIDDKEMTLSSLAMLLQLTIMLFPVLNQMSVYPLVCLTLADNFLVLIKPKSHSDDYIASYRMRQICRLLAAVPPLFLALFFGKIDTIFQWTGLFAFALVFIFPAYLQIRSSQYVRKRFGQSAVHTIYSVPILSSIPFAIAIGTIGIGAMVFSILNLICPQIFPWEWEGV